MSNHTLTKSLIHLVLFFYVLYLESIAKFMILQIKKDVKIVGPSVSHTFTESAH